MDDTTPPVDNSPVDNSRDADDALLDRVFEERFDRLVHDSGERQLGGVPDSALVTVAMRFARGGVRILASVVTRPQNDAALEGVAVSVARHVIEGKLGDMIKDVGSEDAFAQACADRVKPVTHE